MSSLIVPELGTEFTTELNKSLASFFSTQWSTSGANNDADLVPTNIRFTSFWDNFTKNYTVAVKSITTNIIPQVVGGTRWGFESFHRVEALVRRDVVNAKLKKWEMELEIQRILLQNLSKQTTAQGWQAMMFMEFNEIPQDTKFQDFVRSHCIIKLVYNKAVV